MVSKTTAAINNSNLSMVIKEATDNSLMVSNKATAHLPHQTIRKATLNNRTRARMADHPSKEASTMGKVNLSTAKISTISSSSMVKDSMGNNNSSSLIIRKEGLGVRARLRLAIPAILMAMIAILRIPTTRKKASVASWAQSPEASAVACLVLSTITV